MNLYFTARQAGIGIFELFKISGFIFRAWLCDVPHDCPLFPVSDAADVRGQPGQFRFLHGLLLFDCGLLCGFTTAVSDQYKSHFSDSLAAISWLCRVSWCHCWTRYSRRCHILPFERQLLWVSSFSVPVSWDGLSARSTS